MAANRIKKALPTIIVALVAIISYLIYNYAYLVYQEYDYYTYYNDIQGLQRSSPVFINGVRVGEVSNINIKDRKGVMVTMSIKKEVTIPKGSTALLASSGILGEKLINLELTNNKNIYQHKDLITGKYDTSILEMSDQINPILESADYILSTADKNLSGYKKKLENGLVEKSHKDVKHAEANMNKYQKQVAQINSSADKISQSLAKLKNQSAEMVRNKKELNTSITNAEKSTGSLAQQDFTATADELQETVKEVRKKATEVEQSPTVQKALTDDKSYNNANKQIKDAHQQLTEMKENPSGISLIGG